MVINLYRGRVVNIDREAKEALLGVEITDQEAGDLFGSVVDVPVPAGVLNHIERNSEVTVTESPAEEGVVFDLARRSGETLEDTHQKRKMDRLIRNYDYIRGRGVDGKAAWKFAISASISD
jgi:hypothetical protein